MTYRYTGPDTGFAPGYPSHDLTDADFAAMCERSCLASDHLLNYWTHDAATERPSARGKSKPATSTTEPTVTEEQDDG